MILTSKIISYNGRELVLLPSEDISRTILQKEIESVEIYLNDGRNMSHEQRKKIFAIIRDIALWYCDEPECMRAFLMWDFSAEYDTYLSSLATADMTTAKAFINYLIKFCFTHNVPTKKPLITHNDDIGRYLYMCLEHRKCAICNAPAEVHHIDRVGMGRDREHIIHKGLEAIALCREHHTEAHSGEKALFEKHHIFGIKLDNYLCRILNLNKE